MKAGSAGKTIAVLSVNERHERGVEARSDAYVPTSFAADANLTVQPRPHPVWTEKKVRN